MLPLFGNGELILFFNKEECRCPEISILEDTKKQIDIRIGQIHLTGWWAYQLSGYNKEYYGFHTYRRGRLVTIYDKTGLSPNQTIKQVIGELHITGVPITHDKKGWIKASSEYEIMEKELKEYFKDEEYIPRKLLTGYPANRGKVVGTVRKINMFHSADMEKEIQKVNKGDIIVTAMTRPQFLIAIRRAGGIITDLGGSLCHAAIVAREFNIPAVVGTGNANEVLADGQKVIIDGEEGVVYEY